MKVQHFALYAMGLVLVLAIASLFDLSWAGLVPLLVLLGCPLMMLIMMRGMNHDSHDSRDSRGSRDDQDSHVEGPPRLDPRRR